MKISYYIPKGNIGYNIFLNKEIAQAQNIKDKNTKKSVLKGLAKMQGRAREGIVMFYDDVSQELYDMEYKGKSGNYHCGKDFDLKPLNLNNRERYLLVVMDANDCVIGMLNGKEIVLLWKETSGVPRKQDSGGQSEQRFERARQEHLKQWMKKLGDKVSKIYEENR